MQLLSLAVGLLSLLLSCGGVAAETNGQNAIKNAGDRWVPCEHLYGPSGQECRVVGNNIKTRLPKPVKQTCGTQGDCMDASKGKHVVIEYQDFLRMVAMKDHSDKTRDKALAENAVLVKLKDEQGAVIQLQQEDIQACREIVKSHEQLGETEQQISQAVEAELRKGFATEKRLSRYKSEMVYAMGIVAAITWLTRR